MKIIITNIRFLVQVRTSEKAPIAGIEMKTLPVLENAWLSISSGKIEDYGQLPFDKDRFRDYEVKNAKNGAVFPSWVDSHTHIVYAGNREGEFVDRINGKSYSEIA